MTESGSIRPQVFLSSVFKDIYNGQQKYISLRKRIIEAKNTLPVTLWAYEIFWPKGSESPESDADTTINRCFSGIRDCDLFVFLLTGRHGSSVGFLEDPIFATYLELELFAAAMLRKPVLVLHLRGHEPDPGLYDTLKLLRRAFTSGQYILDDEACLYRRFQEACKQLAAGTWTPVYDGVLAELPDWMSAQRSKANIVEELSDPRLRFLDGGFHLVNHSGNPDKARQLLDQVASGIQGGTGNQRLMPHGAALLRLWAAMRELMDNMDRTLTDPHIAPLWDQAFGLWAAKASWFGLHGHVWMGPLAAINSQIHLRKKFSLESNFCSVQDAREPLGARASAIYSIAQRMHSRRRKMHHYRESILAATQAIACDPEAHQGALLIRGHALMQMARLGCIWNLWQAQHDFKESLELRESYGAPPASVGEAKADLGLCSVLIGRRRSGLELLEDGVALMRQDKSANGQAFLARGLRNLERAARFAGRKDIAAAAHQERLSLAAEIEAFDQTREG